MRRPGLTGDIWPDDIQELILRAALMPGEIAEHAWATVRPRIHLDRLPGELHRLMPLLSKALIGHGSIDPDLARLKGVYQFYWYRNTMLVADAADLVQKLSEAAIPVVVLRGGAICSAHRGDVGLRPMNDVDILVRPVDLSRARRVAQVSGWWPLDPSKPLEFRTASAPVRHSAGGVVRLHWQPSPHLSMIDQDWSGLWDRATTARLGGADVLIPSAADHLVHVCVDGARANSGSSLRWIADVLALLRDPSTPLDWDVVVSEARRLRVSLLIGETFSYLARTFDAQVPADVLIALRDTHTTARDRLAHRLSLTTTPRLPAAAEIVGRFTRLTAHMPVHRAAAFAPAFLATALGVEQRRQVPASVLRRIANAVRSPSPALASLSQAGPPGSTAAADGQPKKKSGSLDVSRR